MSKRVAFVYLDGYSTSFKMDPTFCDKKTRIFYYLMLLEDEQSFHLPQDTQGSKTPMGDTRSSREVCPNYMAIFVTVQLRQEVHYQYGPDPNVF